jgi:NNP family nitrate/nitrite transporter-like MFS transporter
MEYRDQADRIDLFNFHTPPMRAFHCTWIAFFICFFAWFGLAPLMPLIREEMRLTPQQMGNLIVASVAATILARLVIGPLCDRFGPRRTYCWLLCLCSLPVMGVGLARNYESLLVFRFAIGAIGASFVITQFHTSVMFSKKCVGAANAAAAGWGNLGGGVTQQVMPLVVAGFVAMGGSSFWAWRGAMFLAGLACFIVGIAYYYLTQDAPAGDFREIRKHRNRNETKRGLAGLWSAGRDWRVWGLFFAYAASFGIELTMDNVAAVYFFDRFGLSASTAGLIAGLFGAMNLFARFLGGWIADRCGAAGGLAARIGWLAAVLVGEGIFLVAFGQVGSVAVAIPTLLVLGLFVKMANGACYAVVPLLQRDNLGSVAGLVGAGGNVGAVVAGFMFRAPSDQWFSVLQMLGIGVLCCSAIPFAMVLRERFALRPLAGAANSVEVPIGGQQ